MKLTVIPIISGALGKFVKRLEDLKIRGQVEAIQITALLRSAGILRVV